MVCDRTVVDCAVYCQLRGFNDLADLVINHGRLYLRDYDQVVFLDARTHPYLYEDGLRDVGEGFRLAVNDRLRRLLEDLADWGCIKDLVIE